MAIASVSSAEPGLVDRVMYQVAEALIERGLRPVGVVPALRDRPIAERCDMELRILPGPRRVRITQNLGRHSVSCKLDATAIEEAVGATEAELSQHFDLFILNKFGQREAEGRGFRPLIAEAIGKGVPVLLGVSEINRKAFDAFVEGMGAALPPDRDAVLGWFFGQTAGRP
ncbi:MAG: DUF2478 domain-containing protein [Acetobacterales bacterium]